MCLLIFVLVYEVDIELEPFRNLVSKIEGWRKWMAGVRGFPGSLVVRWIREISMPKKTPEYQMTLNTEIFP